MGDSPQALRNRSYRMRQRTEAINEPHLIHRCLEQGVIEPVPLWAPLDLQPIEIDMVELIRQGYERVGAAKKLNITAKGFDNRLYRTVRRVGAFSRTHLVAMYYSEECYDRQDLQAIEERGSVWDEWYGRYR